MSDVHLGDPLFLALTDLLSAQLSCFAGEYCGQCSTPESSGDTSALIKASVSTRVFLGSL